MIPDFHWRIYAKFGISIYSISRKLGKDSANGRYLRGSILAQGVLDMYEITKQIKDSGFDGNIFIEYEGMEDCFYGTKVSFDNLKRIYNEV